MNRFNSILYVFAALSAFALPALAFASLTSCVSCSNVTCPTSTTCGNIGTCPNGFIEWGCKYANGTPLSTGVAVTNTTTATTTTPTTSINVTSASTTVPSRTVIQSAHPVISTTAIEYLVVVIVAALVIALIYYLIISKHMKQEMPRPPTST